MATLGAAREPTGQRFVYGQKRTADVIQARIKAGGKFALRERVKLEQL